MKRLTLEEVTGKKVKAVHVTVDYLRQDTDKESGLFVIPDQILFEDGTTLDIDTEQSFPSDPWLSGGTVAIDLEKFKEE